MNGQILVKELVIGSHNVNLYLKEQVPFAECDGQLFPFLWPLIEHLSQLSDPSHLNEFAMISNFFWKGGTFQWIDSVEDYQRFYQDRIAFERGNPADLLEYRLTDFKIFDVSVMHPPTVEKGFLYYYTYQTTNWIPYRVVCPFPYKPDLGHVHYQILPLYVA